MSYWFRYRGAPLLGACLLFSVVLNVAYLSAIMPWSYAAQLDQPKRELEAAATLVRQTDPEAVYVLNTSGMFMTLYAGETLQYLVGRSLPVYPLSSANAVMQIQRISDRSFVLEADREGWLSNMFAKLARSRPELQTGREYKERDFTATLLELTPDRQDVLRVRFDFNAPLADSGKLLLTWDGHRFNAFDYGSLADGETRELADTSDVLAMLTGSSAEGS